ncbi:MAG: hypothetical protein PUB08_07645 [Firmicutes bacterium]|nr:hypothetical protein [Bacillota bacterium]
MACADFNKTVTVFCHYRDTVNQKINWYKFTVQNAFTKVEVKTAFDGAAIAQTASYICRIAKNPLYVSPEAWNALQNKSERFTLKPGDIIYFGATSDTISDGSSGNDFLKAHSGNAFTIKVVRNNSDFFGLGEHYFCSGV